MEDTKKFITKLIPTALWTLATIAASAAAFNTGNGFLIVCGVIAVAGALVRCVKVIKES